jgi:ABC-type nitrate/sulfonate/bicarbonate transport system permease component/ABC-type nitrate/sulfonate/bicarbonate transport system ATPase subunit
MKQIKLLPTLLSILFLGLVWQVIAWSIGYPAIFPSLIDLVKEIVRLFVGDNFYIELFSTVLRGIIGFGLALIFAFLFAIIATFSSFWKAFFHPIIVVSRSVPVISLVLIAILWFSPPQLPVFIALITMFPVLYQNILTGLEGVDYKYVEMGKVFGKSFIQRFISIYFPASKANLFDGMSTAMGFGWRAIIIGEVLAQPIHGIGTVMKQAQAYINVSELIAWTVVAVGVSYLFEFIIKLIRKIRIKNVLPKPQLFKLKSNKQSTEVKEIIVINLEKKFNEIIVCNSFDQIFNSGSVCALKGPSGKGKTTILRLLSKLEEPDSGEIINDKKLRFAYSFQDVRLLPWLTVSENIAYAVNSKHIHRQEISNLVAFLLDKMELADQGYKYPHELSGGQQQRIGLARALAAQADVLLLDEPLTGLDNELKIRIINFLSDWISVYKPLVIWATHENVQLKNTEVREVFV